ncbi:MAG: hypothetical protein H6978_13960 [Gammaproteobacteria bacterium]|nr:hypothetical protein [Gammaproteobacteria bacterium]
MSNHLKRYLLAGVVSLSVFPFGNPVQAADVMEGVKPVGRIGKVSGTGPYPALAEAVAGMRNNTLYHPATMPARSLPLVIWGEGGCRDDGLRYSHFLREIASHGFFIIAGGYPRQEREVAGATPAQPVPPPADAAPRTVEPGNTNVDQLLAAIDWAEEQTTDPQSPFYHQIDTSRVGIMGHSCGGLQAIAVAGDPRVATTIAFNSGVLIKLPDFAKENANLVVEKSGLEKLHGPIAYINGGPEDIAYENAEDDFRLLKHVPVFFAENGVGHGGTFVFDENGGEYAQVAVHWMDWQLNGNAEAGRWFTGPDCALCTRTGWKVRTKNMSGM